MGHFEGNGKTVTIVVMKIPAQISNGTVILSLDSSGAWQHLTVGRGVRSAGIILVVECDKSHDILLAVTLYRHPHRHTQPS